MVQLGVRLASLIVRVVYSIKIGPHSLLFPGHKHVLEKIPRDLPASLNVAHAQASAIWHSGSSLGKVNARVLEMVMEVAPTRLGMTETGGWTPLALWPRTGGYCVCSNGGCPGRHD
ncbi:hypothetical protein FA13DRAFT_1736896, partial [Coprinellus micaceus]